VGSFAYCISVVTSADGCCGDAIAGGLGIHVIGHRCVSPA
jgi:hypothetical protein